MDMQMEYRLSGCLAVVLKDIHSVAFIGLHLCRSDLFRHTDRFGKILVRQIPYGGVEGYTNNYRWKEFMLQWCGYSPTLADGKDFADLEEVREMPHYPDDGSIRVINGTLIVNF